jgi:uncharacterized protein
MATRKRATVEVFGILCDFVRSNGTGPKASHRADYVFDVRQNAKDAIEGAGIPHPEVDLLLVNGASCRFDHPLNDGDLVCAYPPRSPEARLHVSLVRPGRLAEFRFVVDENLGKLASALLLLGFDTLLDQRLDDPDLARVSSEERRVLLTRDVALLKRSCIEHGYWLRSDDPRQQISEVVSRFGLWPHIRPLSRCLSCNVNLDEISAEEAEALVPPIAHATYSEFYHCPSCRKAFWKGAHYKRMSEWLEDLEREFGIRPRAQDASHLR